MVGALAVGSDHRPELVVVGPDRRRAHEGVLVAACHGDLGGVVVSSGVVVSGSVVVPGGVVVPRGVVVARDVVVVVARDVVIARGVVVRQRVVVLEPGGTAERQRQ